MSVAMPEIVRKGLAERVERNSAAIAKYQAITAHWKGISGCENYCLFLGGFTAPDGAKYDLYHYPDYDARYSAAIVFGDDLGNYLSGSVLAMHEAWLVCPEYRELLVREANCGLLTDRDYLTVGKQVLLK